MTERIFTHWKTTLAGTCSAAAGLIGLYTSIYYPGATAPKAVLLASGIAGFITNLLAKDK